MIGLIFGDTDLPREILNKIKKKKIRYLIIDLSRSRNFSKEKNSFDISIGQFGKIIKTLKENNCNRVLFAGKITKPKFSKLKLDFKGLYYIPKIIKAAKLGDAAILKEIIKILKREKIKVISSILFNPELSLSKGIYTKIKPNNFDKKNIKIGEKVLKKLNSHDHIQAIIVRKNKVIAKETSKGTQKMIKLIKKTNFKDAVLIKFPKIKQDLRIDLPTIGLDTLKECKKVGIKGIIVKSKKNIFLDKEKCINFANKNLMFIKVK